MQKCLCSVRRQRLLDGPQLRQLENAGLTNYSKNRLENLNIVAIVNDICGRNLLRCCQAPSQMTSVFTALFDVRWLLDN